METILRIGLADLKTMRIRCRYCGKGVIEVPIAGMEPAMCKEGKCHFCDKELLPGADRTRIEKFEETLAWLGAANRPFGVEFDLAAPCSGARGRA